MVERTLTFAEHIQELRKRLMWSLFFVAIGAGIGYVLHNNLLIILQHPLHETLYYTTPTGAFSFIIKVCTVFGLIVSLPAVLYHGFAFFEPLIAAKTRRTIVLYVLLSVSLAAMGIAFAYYISLPAALHFLVNFGSAGGIESLITANEYFNFVLAYIAGFAVLFQLPLIISFINRVTPLTTGKLLGGTRYVILGSFVVAAIITPTPDPFNQMLMAGPIILLYFFSAMVVVFVNRKRRRREARLARQSVVPARRSVPLPPPVAMPKFVPVVPTPPVSDSVVSTATRPRPAPQPRAMVSDMLVPGRNTTVPAYVPRSQFTAPDKPLRTHRPQPSRGLITDFLPAAE